MAHTFLACVGTRPEVIKMSMLHRALRAAGHKVVVLHTGQHNGMAHALYRFFELDRAVRLSAWVGLGSVLVAAGLAQLLGRSGRGGARG